MRNPDCTETAPGQGSTCRRNPPSWVISSSAIGCRTGPRTNRTRGPRSHRYRRARWRRMPPLPPTVKRPSSATLCRSQVAKRGQQMVDFLDRVVMEKSNPNEPFGFETQSLGQGECVEVTMPDENPPAAVAFPTPAGRAKIHQRNRDANRLVNVSTLSPDSIKDCATMQVCSVSSEIMPRPNTNRYRSGGPSNLRARLGDIPS